MENMLMRRMNPKIIRLIGNARFNHMQAEPECPTSTHKIKDKEKIIHPYCKIHPWRSKIEFCQSMTESVLYNQDGLVAVNKPYGITARVRGPNDDIKVVKHPSGIPNEANYTVADAVPEIASVLGHNSLQIVKTPEKFTSGVVLLASNEKVGQAVEKSLRIAEAARDIPRTYWTITRATPNQLQGERKVAMKLKRTPEQPRPVPIIIDQWSNNARARGDIKILNVQYELLSLGIENLASLLEIKSSTTQWHAVRLFASTVLYSPVLGDRIYGSRVSQVMGKWVITSPVVDAAHVPPRLDPELLKLLKITKNKDGMIPVHMHLREIFLPSFLRKENDVTIKAPLFPEFLWTWEQLKFDDKLLENDANLYIPLAKRNEVT